MIDRSKLPKEVQDWREGWKVLYGRRSYNRHTPASRVYPPCRIVHPYPGCGPLAVFDTRENAERFAGYFREPYRIVRCLWKPSEKRQLWFIIHEVRLNPADEEVLIPVQYTAVKRQLPAGTMFADAVYCLE